MYVFTKSVEMGQIHYVLTMYAIGWQNVRAKTYRVYQALMHPKQHYL